MITWHSLLFLLVLVVLVVLVVRKHDVGEAAEDDVSFDQNYVVRYGNDHFLKLNQGRDVHISLNQTTGSGFNSKNGYGSGFFEMKLKLPSSHSPGVVTTFYLTSHPDNKPGNHDELDFEFLGTDGPNYTLQTNIFANDNGEREQRLHLRFDPTEDFHNYGILWNYRQVVCFVDITSQLECSRTIQCWEQDYWELTAEQQRSYENVTQKYLFYDYCSLRREKFKECQVK
ncbi:hypothetical protein ACFX2G_036206 [Malus domestica]